MKLIQRGNSKLVNMYMFNLPATREVYGRTCRGCYATKEQKRWSNVLPSRTYRYKAANQPMFTATIIKEISSLRKKPKHFRIHASGEFFSQPYIDSWTKIATTFPNIVFYAYTKRLKEFDFSKLKSLPNVVIIDSFHYGGLNYGKLYKAPKDAVICPHGTVPDTICGTTCTTCMNKSVESTGVWFKEH